MNDKSNTFPCPCCGYLTKAEPDYGTFMICPVCFWEDDCAHFYNDPNCRGGANEESLNESKENFKKFGACSKEAIKFVRDPLPDELPK